MRAPSSVSKVRLTTASLGNGLKTASSWRVPGFDAPDGKYQFDDGDDEQAAIDLPVGPCNRWYTATSPPSTSTTAAA